MAFSVPADLDITTQISQAITSQSPKACLHVLSLLSRKPQVVVPDEENTKKRLKVLAMPLLNINELTAIFSGLLTITFEYPVPDRLRVRLLSLPNDQRDEIKHQIENNLLANVQPFVAGAPISPSEWIARWLLSDRSVAEYVKSDLDFTKLNRQDQLCVERLLSTYQLVSHSSDTIEGTDEEIVMRDEKGHLQILRNGRVMELNNDRLEDNPPVVPSIPPTPKVTPIAPLKSVFTPTSVTPPPVPVSPPLAYISSTPKPTPPSAPILPPPVIVPPTPKPTPPTAVPPLKPTPQPVPVSTPPIAVPPTAKMTPPPVVASPKPTPPLGPVIIMPIVMEKSPLASSKPAEPIVSSSSQQPPDKPKFYFHEEDEADIAKHRAKLLDGASVGGADYSHLIEKLVQDYVIQLPDEQSRVRFENIITSRFKDIRDQIQTREMLSRPYKIGGVGLPPDLVDQIIVQLEEQAKLVHAAKNAPKPVKSTPTPEPSSPSESIPSLSATPIVPEKTSISSPKVVAPSLDLPVVPETLPSTPPKPAEKVKPVIVTATKTNESVPKPSRPISPPPPVIKRPIDGIRPVVSDIRPPTRVMGPIEELAALTIDDYRRLGRNLVESNQKVMEKLDLLQEESFIKRAEGTQAWKSSPAHQLYLAVGRASMESNLAVVDVIQQYRAAGQPTLTPQEFDALADLNKQISY